MKHYNYADLCVIIREELNEFNVKIFAEKNNFSPPMLSHIVKYREGKPVHRKLVFDILELLNYQVEREPLYKISKNGK